MRILAKPSTVSTFEFQRAREIRSTRELGKIMRAMVLRGLRWPDPFPDLPDCEYYHHFSPWFRELKERVCRDGRNGA